MTTRSSPRDAAAVAPALCGRRRVRTSCAPPRPPASARRTATGQTNPSRAVPARWIAPGASAVASLSLLAGCTAESTRIAIDAQRRADDVQRAVFDRQHDGLKVLLFRDAQRQLESAKSHEQRTLALNNAWNDRDLLEFWQQQYDRAAALRLVGVDAKLYADQSMLDLLIKQIDTRVQRAEKGWAAAKARQAGKAAAESATRGGGTGADADADADVAPRLDPASPDLRDRSSRNAAPQVFQTQRIPEGAPR